MAIPKHIIEELARAWASIDGRADRFDIGKNWEGSQSESPDGGTYEGYLADTEELVKRSPSVAAALSDDLPFRRDDIMRGLILFRTSNNAHGYTNFVSLTAKVDALPQVAKDELATMMRNFADQLSPVEPREMTGFLATLTPEQRAKALAYRGPENHGEVIDITCYCGSCGSHIANGECDCPKMQRPIPLAGMRKETE